MDNPKKTSMQWLFKKNCSFTPKQVGIFYLAQSTLSLIVASFFLYQGVWLILPFTLLELAVLAIALLIYARHATDYEKIDIRQGELLVETSNAGKVMQFVFNPSWVRVDSVLNSQKLISINYQEQVLEVGRFIHVSLRKNFLIEFAQALRKNF
jgi:uncharacterized membrane protein